MRILFLTSSAPAGPAFGTEIVAQGLADRFAASGAQVHVAAHASDPRDVGEQILAEGIRAHRLAPLPKPTREESYAINNVRAPGVQELMQKVRPDIVQIYGLTANGINRRHIQLAKSVGGKVVLWHNVPGITCLQRGLLLRGRTPCDGRVQVRRCTSCRLQAAGAPRSLAAVASRVSLGPFSTLLPRRAQGVAAARDFTRTHKQAVADAFANIDATLVGADWAKRVMMANGVPEHRLHLVRPGVNLREAPSPPFDPESFWQYTRYTETSRPVRLIYWGRVHRSKGLHTVIEAMAKLPDLQVEFAVFGNTKAKSAQPLHQQAKADARIRFYDAVKTEHVLTILRTADIAMIPSRWHETGPLTVFEAQAAGLPIIGSDRGGVGELCVGPSARRFPAENAAALAELLVDVVNTPGAIDGMRANVPEPRTMDHVAAEVRNVYSQVLTAAHSSR